MNSSRRIKRGVAKDRTMGQIEGEDDLLYIMRLLEAFMGHYGHNAIEENGKSVDGSEIYSRLAPYVAQLLVESQENGSKN